MRTAAMFDMSVEPLEQDFEEPLRALYQLVCRTAYSISGRFEAAEDMLQILFVKLMQRGLPPGLQKNPKGYIYRAGRAKSRIDGELHVHGGFASNLNRFSTAFVCAEDCRIFPCLGVRAFVRKHFEFAAPHNHAESAVYAGDRRPMEIHAIAKRRFRHDSRNHVQKRRALAVHNRSVKPVVDAGFSIPAKPLVAFYRTIW